MPPIRFLSSDPGQIETDLLVIPMFDGEALAASVPGLDAATGGEIARATSAGELRGRLYDLFVTPSIGNTWTTARIAVAGAGKAGDFSTERLRKLAAAAAL